MATELPVVLEVLSDDLENYIFGEEGDNFNCLAATASDFRQENQQSASTVFSLDVAQKHAGSPNHTRKDKQKKRLQNLIRFHLQGCSCVLKRLPKLPTSKDTPCIDKRFGVQLAFFLGSTTVRSLAPGSVDISGNSGKS